MVNNVAGAPIILGGTDPTIVIPSVMVSLDDYESLKEAAYLLRSPANARRLLASIDRLEAGGGTERDLAE